MFVLFMKRETIIKNLITLESGVFLPDSKRGGGNVEQSIINRAINLTYKQVNIVN